MNMKIVKDPEIFDLHTHHNRCGHAKARIRDYVEAAISNGLDMIGISDHSPHFYSEKDQLYTNITMKKSEFQDYVQEILHLKEEYKDTIEILLGVESDFFPEHIEIYRNQYNQYPFDYIIGSVHFVDGINIFKKARWEGLTKEEKVRTKESYYNLIQQSAESGLFQVLGHIDAMQASYHDFNSIPTDVIEHTLKVIGQNQIAIEINTSGKGKGCGWFPSDDILERALYYGIDVTFGSDAHTPERVGEEFNLVKQKLIEIGFTRWCFFRRKERFYIQI